MGLLPLQILKRAFWLVVSLGAIFSKTVCAQTIQTSNPSPDNTAKRLVLYDGPGGASCTHYLANAVIWEKRSGDWIDAKGLRFGSQAFAITAPTATGAVWDATALARKWLEADDRQGGFFLRVISGTGYASFSSRESKNVADRPTLVLVFADGQRKYLAANADTQLDCSTTTSLGTADKVLSSPNHHALFQFPLTAAKSIKSKLERAQLVLSSAAAPGGGTTQIGVFEIATPRLPDGPIQPGLAKKYPMDQGVTKDADVIFAENFDHSRDWPFGWAKGALGEMDLLAESGPQGFVPLLGTSLRVNLKKGANLGADLRLKLRDFGPEPDELFFRYYLRLGDDWKQTIADGKMPGMAGTYNAAGWGGRKADGTKGWSMRGGYQRGFEAGHPLHNLWPLGSYAYHADMKGTYGDIWQWPGVFLERNRWYSIEQQVKLNDLGKNNGVLKVWLDGRLVMEKLDLQYRKSAHLHIEWVWFNVYHGGAAVSPEDQHLFIDNVVVARKYIGPITTLPSN